MSKRFEQAQVSYALRSTDPHRYTVFHAPDGSSITLPPLEDGFEHPAFIDVEILPISLSEYYRDE